ncbi:MAG TPA: DUF1579 family protein, partial [Fimbriimonadaceae bacterium]|nr:DUF1579 family protein [Fimbriimonadaceae bacterium]
IGEWSGTTKWVMQGMEGEGPMTMKNEWEGQFLKSATVTEADGVKMTELSLLGWNAKTKKFDSWTFTNFGATPRLEHGELEGDKLVMASEPWDVMGQKMEGRGTMTKKSATEILFILEFKMDGKWVKAAEGTYRKK